MNTSNTKKRKLIKLCSQKAIIGSAFYYYDYFIESERG